MTSQLTEANLPGHVHLTKDVVCPMRDGTKLLCDVYHPAGDREFPVLLMRTPYGKGAAQAHDVGPYAHPSWFAGQGYIVVIQDIRGRHTSEGKFVPHAYEVADGHDTLEWCTRLAGAREAVGMFGMSYPGFVQLAAASSGHPALKCISAGFTAADPYQWAMKSGLPRLAFVLGWALGLAMDEAARQGKAEDARCMWEWTLDPARLYGQMPLLGSYQLDLIAHYMPFVRDWLTRDDPASEYWEKQRFAPASIPAFYLAGWYDIWIKETIELYENQQIAQGNARLLVGPWSHVPWRGACGPDCDGCAAELSLGVNHLLLQWFDWHLKGIQPSSWLGSDCACWFDYGDRRWVTGELKTADSMRLGIASDGLATVSDSGCLVSEARQDTDPAWERPAADVIVDDPLIPTPSVGGWSCCYESMAPIGAKDQGAVEEMSQVAVYTAGPLPVGTRICGKPRVTLEVTLEQLPATVVTTLCLVRRGRSFNISRGVWRKKGADRESSWVDVTAEIEMSPVALTLGSDDRIRLLVQGSSFPEVEVDPHQDVLPAMASRTDMVRDTLIIRHGPGSASSLVLPLGESETRGATP